MTSKDLREKYPVGTRIKYKGNAGDDGNKRGKIVGFDTSGDPIIYLPTSIHVSWHSKTLGRPITWGTAWGSIEILSQKNEQLLFDFMYSE